MIPPIRPIALSDIEAARAAGLPCGVVGWGATPLAAMAAFDPAERFERVEEIVEAVLRS